MPTLVVSPTDETVVDLDTLFADSGSATHEANWVLPVSALSLDQPAGFEAATYDPDGLFGDTDATTHEANWTDPVTAQSLDQAAGFEA